MSSDSTPRPRRPRRNLPPRTTEHLAEWGSPSRYNYVKKRCGCDGCVAANRDYARHRSTAPKSLVDATPAREHLAALRATGLGLRSISKMSGVPRDTLIDLARTGTTETGRARRIHHSIEAAILSISLDSVTVVVKVNAELSRDRLRALVANGWSQAEMTRHLEIGRITALHGLISGRVANIPIDLAESISKMYASLNGQPGPSQWAKRIAEQKGWTPLEVDPATTHLDTDVVEAPAEEFDVPNEANGYFDWEFFQKSSTWAMGRVS